jgi:hypothetical protein
VSVYSELFIIQIVTSSKKNPNSDILHAELDPRPPKVWRAIMEGKKILQLGIIKRISLGRNIGVYSLVAA